MSPSTSAMSDAAILDQIRELAGGISDERTRTLMVNLTSAVALNPQPLPPASLRTVLEAVALNPQPLPPVEASELNPQPLPPEEPAGGTTPRV